jgi:riboflavin biosynthesis pyrimidine reductase
MNITGRPRIICHMTTSVDGRIVADGWPDSVSAAVRREYEAIHASYEADGWMCGRVTMEPFAKRVRSEDEVRAQRGSATPRDDFRAPGDFDSFAFALDSHGRLAWESNDISGDHVVAILTERVSDEYLNFLRSRGVSYIIAGAEDVDLAAAVEKVGAQFGVRTLMLEGGGRINGSMLQAGLIDEISVLIAPTADGRAGTPTLFDADKEGRVATRLRLEHVERREDDLLWLRYQPRDG